MKKKKKLSTEGNKPDAPKAAMLGFLGLLNHISVSPDVLEFCTPGHKAGRGFQAMVATEQTHLLLALPKEVG